MTEQEALTFWRWPRERQVRTQNKVTESGALTTWRWQRDRQVRTRKESDKAKGTHILETTEGRSGQDTESMSLSKRHSQTGNHRGRDKSGNGKNMNEREVLTSWRQQREGQLMTWKESNKARDTHFLETADRGTSQDRERMQPREGYSPAGDSRRKGKLDTEIEQPSK